MTHPTEDTAIRAALESLTRQGLAGMGEAVQLLLNEAMKIERAEFLQAAPALVEWAEESIPQGLTVFDRPQAHRLRLRTTNGLERLNREIKRRTRAASLFPNEAALLRLASAILVEIDEEWQTGKIYLNMKSD